MLPTQAASVRHISDMTHYTQEWRFCQAQISIFAFHDSTKEKGWNLLSDRKKPRSVRCVSSEWSLNHFLSGHVPDRKTSQAASAVRRTANRMEPSPVAIAQKYMEFGRLRRTNDTRSRLQKLAEKPEGIFRQVETGG